MCGRFSLALDAATLKERFQLAVLPPSVRPRYNIAPSQDALVILAERGRRVASLMRWGLVPSGARDPAVGNRLINARADTALERPAFRSSFQRRRCLVPADGFYEWEKPSRTPVRYVPREGGAFALAGLWDEWKGPRGPLRSFTILTTEANALVRAVHARMPAVLRPEDESGWLDEGVSSERLRRMLEPRDPDAMRAYRVSRRLNSAENEGPDLVEEAEDAQRRLL